MKVSRLFTAPTGGLPTHDNPFQYFKWKEVAVLIKDAKGKVLCDISNLEVPEQWSQQAAEILAHKYLRKSGVGQQYERVAEDTVPQWLQRVRPGSGVNEDGQETSFRQVAHRIVGHWTYAGWDAEYFGPQNSTYVNDVADEIINADSEENARAFYDELVYMMCAQMVAPNSPQFFNTGLWWAYGARGETINHHAIIDPTTNEAQSFACGHDNAYKRPQTSACFISSLNDTLVGPGGIMEALTKEATIFKYGSGSGMNYSALRGKDAPLSGGGKSSGLMSFLDVFDRNAGAIKSGGTTRRAARMVVVNSDHPEAKEFVRWKHREELKVAAMELGASLMQEGAEDAGFPEDAQFLGTLNGEFESEAYRTVSGQNSNNSLRVTDEFMESLEVDLDDTMYSMKSTPSGKPLDPSIDEMDEHALAENNQDLWNALINAAWSCGDPGVQFHDTCNSWHTVPKAGAQNATNPCSEFSFLDDTACNLASINLISFFPEGNSTFNALEFMHVVDLFTRVLDITVGFSSYPDPKTAENSIKYRPLGLGYANLGGLLMAMGISYGSQEGMRVAAAITSLMQAQAMTTSIEMAKSLGPFYEYPTHHEDVKRVLEKHRDASDQLEYADMTDPVDNDIVGKVLEEQTVLWQSMDLSQGMRNAQLTLLAPTGTISFVMDCATTGIEPEFSLSKFKKLAGGGSMQIVNPMVARGLDALGYDQQEINTICTHMEEDGIVPKELLHDPEHYNVFECANEINYFQHISMMAYVQPFLSGAISKTVNLPADATREDVSDAYKLAWQLGIKAVAIYRDGCKSAQPLTAVKKVTKSASDEGGSGNDNEPVDGEVGSPAEIDWPVEITPAPELVPTAELPAEVIPHINPDTGSFEAPKGEDGKPTGLTKTGYIRCDPVAGSTLVGKPKVSASRYKLPNRRSGITQKVTIGGYNLYLRTGEYDNGDLGEIFLTISKEGTMLNHMISSWAIAVSLGLQYGVPLSEYVDAFADSKSEPNGFVQGSDNVKFCSSIIDFVAKELDGSYGNGEFKKPTTEPTNERTPTPTMGPAQGPGIEYKISTNDQLSEADKALINSRVVKSTTDALHITKGGLVAAPRTMSATKVPAKSSHNGNACTDCGSFTLKRNGSCFVCDTCGTTTGCS